jgi:hypothetical protein
MRVGVVLPARQTGVVAVKRPRRALHRRPSTKRRLLGGGSSPRTQPDARPSSADPAVRLTADRPGLWRHLFKARDDSADTSEQIELSYTSLLGQAEEISQTTTSSSRRSSTKGARSRAAHVNARTQRASESERLQVVCGQGSSHQRHFEPGVIRGALLSRAAALTTRLPRTTDRRAVRQ